MATCNARIARAKWLSVMSYELKGLKTAPSISVGTISKKKRERKGCRITYKLQHFLQIVCSFVSKRISSYECTFLQQWCRKMDTGVSWSLTVFENEGPCLTGQHIRQQKECTSWILQPRHVSAVSVPTCLSPRNSTSISSIIICAFQHPHTKILKVAK